MLKEALNWANVSAWRNARKGRSWGRLGRWNANKVVLSRLVVIIEVVQFCVFRLRPKGKIVRHCVGVRV